MSTANVALVSSQLPVDQPSVSIRIEVTDPNGGALPRVVVPATSTSATIPDITINGAYRYVITTVDGMDNPVTNAGVVYPSVSGTFTNTVVAGSGPVISSATVTLA